MNIAAIFYGPSGLCYNDKEYTYKFLKQTDIFPALVYNSIISEQYQRLMLNIHPNEVHLK